MRLPSQHNQLPDIAAYSGMVFNIQRFSLHDGPGIRTVVFLKGCTLRCSWCHNPESISPAPQVQYFPHNCIGCGKCFQVCPSGAHIMENEQRIFARELCTGCGHCSEQCYAEALILRGKSMTVKEIVDEAELDRSFYDTSQGGVTFSGGEPLAQPLFLRALLAECQQRNLHTAIETAGKVPWEHFAAALPYVDNWFYDFKMLDNSKHQRATGSANGRILDNMRKLTDLTPVTIRIPVIPGYSADPAEMRAMVEYIAGLRNVVTTELLPFQRLCSDKYASIGLNWPAGDLTPPDAEQMQALLQLFRDRQMPVTIVQ